MTKTDDNTLRFKSDSVKARFVNPKGEVVEHLIEIRTNPITLRTCRITYSRINEKETGAKILPQPPPDAADSENCPFCKPQIFHLTPKLPLHKFRHERLCEGDSILFPNLFPYGSYSAVSLFDNHHFVEIGTADGASYTNSFVNCAKYLKQIRSHDRKAEFMAITQNHLPSAGGSLVHPHLQVYADHLASNNHRILSTRANAYHKQTGNLIYQDYLKHELRDGARIIGQTGAWKWMAAFAPEGFFEIWGILPGMFSLSQVNREQWTALAQGVLNAQKFFRSRNRNGYNLGLLAIENEDCKLELRVSLIVRSNHAPWVRNDHTGFEVMLSDMATFTAPEMTAEMARPFWQI
jgi:UDPglucose--hexose-1-phosphate uridylyltransferase